MAGAGIAQGGPPRAESFVDRVEAVEGAADPSYTNDPGLGVAPDLDFDGLVDGADLTMLLGNWTN